MTPDRVPYPLPGSLGGATSGGLPQELREQIYAECYRDPALFGFTFLKDWFPVQSPDEISWMQRGVLAILTRRANFLLDYGDHEKIATNFLYREGDQELPVFTFDYENQVVEMVVNRFDSIMIPRGFSKTTLVNTAVVHAICYKLRNFIVYISEAAGHSEMQLAAVKLQIKTNAPLQEVYGVTVPEKNPLFPDRSDDTKFSNGVRIMAKGRNAQIRGLNDNGARPDWIVLDDVEDKESVKVDTQRVKTRNWFYSDVRWALPRRHPTASIIVVGTLLHGEALLQTVQSDPTFHSITFGAYDRQGDPLAPQFMTADEIEAARVSATAVGELASFYMEVLSQIRNEETAKFKQSHIIWEPPPGRDDFVGFALAVDPAIAETVDADYFSIAACAMHKKGLIWVLDTWSKKGVHPGEQVDKIFEFFKLLPPWAKVGIEGISYQRALIHLTREEMFRRHCYFEIIDIKHGKVAKHERVEGVLAPRYRSGYMRHARRFPELETQLLDWPNGKKDAPDAVAMAVTLLDPYAAAAAGDKDLGENEYEPLRIKRQRAP